MPNKNDFMSLVENLLAAPNGHENRDKVIKMAEMLHDVTGISVEDDISVSRDKVLGSGVAICPVKAAKCLLEVVRTQVFLKAIYKAIADRTESKKTIHILYAGTGPYGTILLPLLPFFKEHNIKVQCLDIHEDNVVALRKVADWLEITGDTFNIELADATQWRSNGQLFDLIISETMNTFLHREPQVRIFANLSQYLAEDGDLIPQEIRTSAEIRPVTVDGPTSISCALLVLNAESSEQIRKGNTSCFFHELTLPDSKKIYQNIDLNTDIQVYDEHVLGLNDCSLNLQKSKSSITSGEGQTVAFEYVLNDDPYWKIDVPNLFETLPVSAIEKKSSIGLYYLQRFWDKYRRMVSGAHSSQNIANEHQLDVALMDLTALDLQTMMLKAVEHMSDFTDFEAWFLSETSGLDEEKVKLFNRTCLSHSSSPVISLSSHA